MVSFFSAIYANIIFCDCYNSLKQNFINEFKNKAKKADEDAINKVKWLVNDVNGVISHTNDLLTDEFLKANTLVLENATEEDKKKLKDIFAKNLKKIKESTKYGENSVFYTFTIENNLSGIIEFDKTKLTNEFLEGVLNRTKEDVKVIELKDLEKF